MTRTDPAGDDDVPARFHVDFTGQDAARAPTASSGGSPRAAMGSVYLAEDTNLGRRVVVKVPHARFLGEPGFRARFRREIAELVRLEHPHVVRILARGEEDDVPYFVLQFLGRRRRSRTGSRRAPQSPAAALALARARSPTRSTSCTRAASSTAT